MTNHDTELPRPAVERDRTLSARHERTSRDLAYHRWHWTLDETNPQRVTMAAYARSVGLTHRTVQVYAHGYGFLESGEVDTISDGLERARLGEDTYVAAQAVAEVRGTTVAAARGHRLDEIRRVRNEARHVASARGTSLASAAREVAERVVNGRPDEATTYLEGAARELAHALAAREREGVVDDDAEHEALGRVERCLSAYLSAVRGASLDELLGADDRNWLDQMGVKL